MNNNAKRMCVDSISQCTGRARLADCVASSVIAVLSWRALCAVSAANRRSFVAVTARETSSEATDVGKESGKARLARCVTSSVVAVLSWRTLRAVSAASRRSFVAVTARETSSEATDVGKESGGTRNASIEAKYVQAAATMLVLLFGVIRRKKRTQTNCAIWN